MATAHSGSLVLSFVVCNLFLTKGTREQRQPRDLGEVQEEEAACHDAGGHEKGLDEERRDGAEQSRV